MTNTLFWFIVFVLFIILEITTAGLFFLSFAIGAIATAIVSFFTHNLYIEAVVFAVVSIITITLIRPTLKKFLYKSKEEKPDYIDSFNGQSAKVIQEITPSQSGQIKVGSEVWTAVPENNESFLAGEVVSIVKIEGVKAIVKKGENL